MRNRTLRTTAVIASLIGCSGCVKEYSSAGPSTTVRVSASQVPTGGVELKDVTVDEGQYIGLGLPLAAAMSDVLQRAIAQGGNFVLVDQVYTRFVWLGMQDNREVAVTHVHARVFRVSGRTP